MNDRFRDFVLGVALFIMVGWVLTVAREIILPIVFGLIVAYIVIGLADIIGRLPTVGSRVPSPVRLLLAIGLMGLALFSAMSLMVTHLGSVVARAPEYEEALLALIQNIAVRFGIETEPTWQTLRRDVLGQIDLQRLLGSAVASVASIVATFAIVAVYAWFMLLEQGAFAAKLASISDEPMRVARIREIIAAINARVGTYLAMKTGINALLGLACYVILRLAGIELAGFWALLIGLMNYIPYVGSFIGVTFPVAVALVQFGTIGPPLTLAVALTSVQIAIGNFIEPWLMGTSLNLSPLVILLSLVVWSSIWGIAGAILAVPVTAMLVIVFSEFAGTRPIAILLSKDGSLSRAKTGPSV